MKSDKPRVLIFVDWYVPAFKAGGPIRSVYNMVKQLSDHFQFYIATGDRDLGDDKPYPNINFDQWNHFSGAEVKYLSAKNQKIKTFRKIIEEVNPDTIYLNSLFSFNFSLIPLWLKKKFPDVKFVLAPRGMLGKGALEIKKRKKEVFIGISRIIKLYKGLVWHATFEGEKNEIQKVFGKDNTVIIAGNVATKPQFTFKNIIKLKLAGFKMKKFLYVSRISRKKNVELLINWFLELTKIHSNIKLKIIGNEEDKTYFEELKKSIKDSKHIKLHKALHPDELAKYYAEAHFFCLPTRHENFGHVIIEALSYGCPVIISNRTPWRKLQEKEIGWDIPLDKPQLFKEALESCILMDETTYLHRSEKASMFAHDYIFESDLNKKYIKLLSP